MDKIQFENFKGYKEITDVPVKKLNVIMGCNSSGKSSIFHLIQLLRQSISVQNQNALAFSSINNKHKDLVSFNNVIFSHDTSLKLNFSFSGSLERQVRGKAQPGYEFKVDYSIAGVGRSTSIDLYKLWGKLPDGDFVELFAVVGELSIEDEPGKKIYKFLSSSEENINAFGETKEFMEFVRDFSKMRELNTISDFFNNVTIEFDGIIPKSIALKRKIAPRGRSSKDVLPKWEVNRMPIEMALPFWGSSIVAIEAFLGNCNFIGPIRDQILPFYSNRDIPPDDSIGYHGENLGYYLQNGTTVSSINKAFEILEIPYTIEVLENDSIDGMAIFLKTKGDIPINIRPDSVGSGISQLMPILVECSVNKNATTLIEQPELHLHPRQHVLLAEFLIQSLCENSNQAFWIETHSEFILQGLLFHAKKKGIKSKDINIVCVNAIDGEARLKCVEPRNDYSYSFPFDMKLFPLIDFFVEV
jgi:AAA15 family ATPase/GTPase